MSSSNDALIVLLAKRGELYEQLRLMDLHVTAAQKSPFFSTRQGNAATMGYSIEGVENQIGDIDRQITLMRGRTPDEAELEGQSV